MLGPQIAHDQRVDQCAERIGLGQKALPDRIGPVDHKERFVVHTLPCLYAVLRGFCVAAWGVVRLKLLPGRHGIVTETGI